MPIRLLRSIKLVRRLFVYRPIVVLVTGLALFYLWATLTIMAREDLTFGRAAGLIMPAFLGELGQVECTSIVTRVSVLVALLASVAFVAVLTAGITSRFVEFCRAGGSVVSKVRASGHIVICGWNDQGEKIVDELLRSSGNRSLEVVILANREHRPLKDIRVEFVRGDPTQDEALRRAGVDRADSVIVLSSGNRSANDADAEALMVVLAVESLNRSVHSSVLIMNSDNRVHFERAHADEIICLDQMGGSFLVAAATNHGVSKVVGELLTFNSGSELYRYDKPLSDELLGKEFSEAAKVLADRRVILLGFETEDSEDLRRALRDDIVHSTGDGTRVLVVNPQGRHTLRQGDALFVIAESEPARL